MFEMDLGSPDGVLVFFLLFMVIGVVLGGVIFAVMAFPGARRDQFRTFGAMPKTGLVVGILVAGAIILWASRSESRREQMLHSLRQQLHALHGWK